ncbi:MAG: hypothetical protein D6726_05820 [Nitrospirae bacterium]|nr:MAG: hypothetical protein D6726_05820 [Nitrospirota bacterium]
MKNNQTERQRPFYPDYLFEVTLVIFITLEVVTVLALIFPQPLGRMINFTAPYQPLPEWYFYWLYQLVRYFPGRWMFVGTVLIPLLIILLLFYLPWIEKGKAGRKGVLVITFLILSAFLILTLIPALKY